MSLWRKPLPAELALAWPKGLRTAVFRDACAFAGVLVVSVACVSLIVGWQTIAFLRQQIDAHLLTDARAIAAEPGPQLLSHLSLAIESDPLHRRVGALFDRNGVRIEGNLDIVPHPLPAIGTMGRIDDPVDHPPPGKGQIPIGRLSLPDGRMLVFGRRVDELDLVGAIVRQTLLIAAIPTVGFCFFGGWLVWRMRVGRLRAVEDACGRIMSGDFRQRLPVTGLTSEFRIVSLTINRMLDEVERLMLELRGAGDAMAHDLRTPLTRLRTRLGRIVESDFGAEAARSAIGKTVEDVDQLIAIIRAMLRLGWIENGERRASFSAIEIGPIAESAAELFAPIAEEKGLEFRCDIGRGIVTFADGELLFEAIANLLDNAVKFTQPGGGVALRVKMSGACCEVEVEDTGPGIAANERDAVKRRFYRGDPARGISGSGLGLAIVSAIARLHGSEVTLADGPAGTGCRAVLTFALDDGRPAENTAASALPARAKASHVLT